MLELGLALARAGAPDAIAPLSEIVEHGDEEEAIVAAAIELGGMLFYAGRAAEGAAIMHRAEERLPAGAPGREQLEVALLGVSYISASARREADATIAALRDPGGPARNVLQATTLATLALDEVMFLRSASTAIDLAGRALAAGLPPDPHRGENWAVLALVALALSDHLDAAQRGMDEILAQARERGAASTVATFSALRATIALRCGDLIAAQAYAQAAIELAAIGVRPRSTDRSGADSLTPSERRVVEIAAAGSTNREIAQTLFVTEKTVETHLGRAFRKLDVSSRRQLPDVLASAVDYRAHATEAKL